MITTEGLTKSFGEIRALDGFNFNAPKGINGLIGPNAAGKTTLIHLITGLIKPDSGSVQVMGFEPWSERHQLMKRVGVLLERATLPLNVSGARYIQHLTRLRGISDRDVRVVLDHVGLLKASERHILGYSAGMKKRLGIAKALLGNPELVILDEPTADLDPNGRIQLLRLIKRMHREQGTNFLLSSHTLPELQKVCSWVCLMHEGKDVEEDFVEALLDKYSSGIYVIRVSDPDALASALSNLGGLKVKVKGNSVYVKGNSGAIRHQVPKLIGQTDGEMESFGEVGRNLENVFLKALRQKKARQ